jgi:hypothetical protein
MLIDRFLPAFDVTEVHEVEVDAPPEIVYSAIRQADLHDPVIDALFTVRELPTRLAEKLRGVATSRAPEAFTFEDMAKRDMPWMLLAEDRGSELVIGSVGKFWRGDYGWRPVPAKDFASFNEPGYAKLAISLSLWPTYGATQLRYEARTVTTDVTARAHFRRYWRLIRLGVGIVMHRALRRIKAEAERRAASQLVEVGEADSHWRDS